MIAIAAVSKNWIIGNNNKIPWHSFDDFKHFKSITIGKTLLVGRKTFDGLPILKERDIIVLSDSLSGDALWEYYVKNKHKSCNLYIRNNKNLNIDKLSDVVLIGGAQLYKKFLVECSEFYLTIFDFNVEGDTFFPFTLGEIALLFKKRVEFAKIKDGVIYKFSNIL